ncbi:hypothetical protein D3C78_1258200 [compost metagenome]
MAEIISFPLVTPPLWRGLRLLCLMYRMPRGRSCSQPVLTLHRGAPWARLRGVYPQANRKGSVALDLRSWPAGPGLYLREVPCRRPGPSVLERCRPAEGSGFCRSHPVCR